MEQKIAVHVAVERTASDDWIAHIVGLVHGSRDVARLRRDARLVGVALGPETTGDREDASVTVQLSMAEVVVGVCEGYLEPVVAEDTAVDATQLEGAMRCLIKTDEASGGLIIGDDQTRLRVRVFADLWERGYFVAFGSKFGVDFLVYKADPSSCHSFAMVIIKDYTTAFATVDIVSHCRLAKMVKKAVWFVSQRHDDIVYVSLDHAVLATAQSERR